MQHVFVFIFAICCLQIALWLIITSRRLAHYKKRAKIAKVFEKFTGYDCWLAKIVYNNKEKGRYFIRILRTLCWNSKFKMYSNITYYIYGIAVSLLVLFWGFKPEFLLAVIFRRFDLTSMKSLHEWHLNGGCVYTVTKNHPTGYEKFAFRFQERVLHISFLDFTPEVIFNRLQNRGGYSIRLIYILCMFTDRITFHTFPKFWCFSFVSKTKFPEQSLVKFEYNQ